MDSELLGACRVVLQDGQADRWLLFGEPVRVLQATSAAEVLGAVQAAEHAVETDGVYAAGFIAYEAAPGFDPALRVRAQADGPLLWLGLFEPPEIAHELPAAVETHSLGDWEPAADRQSYRQAVAAIKAQIAAGYTYQINYTFPLVASFAGDPWSLFVQVVRAQQARYAGFVDTGRHVICSTSPELFFHLEQGVLTSRPMKGTASRGRTPAQDEAQRAWLRASEKNRAENVMIVDMIRNDMGRVAEVGSVHVPVLFEVERYPTVLQMTSTVTAATIASRADVLRALFPCASITGAPKVSAMHIIAGLEQAPRGVYTGALGYLAPGGRAQFNVAIRTVAVDRHAGRATYGVGSGIVWDSDADDEYDECILKARVLTEFRPDFELLETMLWRPDTGIVLLHRHLERLVSSADYFGFAVDRGKIEQQLASAVATLPKEPHRVRLLVGRSGVARIQGERLPDPLGHRQVLIGLAQAPVERGNVFLYHKTTWRETYEAAQRSRPECEDVLLWNERGEITETCLANVALSLNGELVTPPVDCGLLAGTLRGALLDEGWLHERVVRVDELSHCAAIYVLNSVRGWREAVLS